MGFPEELLVGGDLLSLWNIPESGEPSVIWESKLASPVRIARFSHDAGLIASCGLHDRLVKIWRRLSYEFDSTRFDVSYLAHPISVTNLHWRKPWHLEQNLDNVLYTFCADDRIRVWIYSDPHARSAMQLVADIDLQTSIQPRTPIEKSSRPRRFGFVLDSRDFSRATENTVQKSTGQSSEHALEHLIEIAGRSPEICVVLDDRGHISAWGLENVGCKNRLPPTTFNVVHVKGMGIPLPTSGDHLHDYIQFCTFAGGISKSSLTLLVHYFDGRIDWYDTQIAELFDPAPLQQRTRLISSWTGHDAMVSRLQSDSSDRTMVSSTERSQTILWKENEDFDGPALQLTGSFDSPTFSNGQTFIGGVKSEKFVATIDTTEISLWNTEQSPFSKVASTRTFSALKVLHFFSLPSDRADEARTKLVSMYDNLTAILWEIRYPSQDRPNGNHKKGKPLAIRKICDLDTDALDPNATVMPIPAPKSSAGLPNQACLMSISLTGTVKRLFPKFDADNRRGTWQIVSVVEICVHDISLYSADSSGKIGAVESGGRDLSIWDTVDGQLEFQQRFDEQDIIERLCWISTPHGCLILAVGFPYKILLLGQLPFRLQLSSPAWTILHQVRTRDFATHSLGDLCWLSKGNLVLGIGNQLFVCKKSIEAKEIFARQLRLSEKGAKSIGLLGLVDRLNVSLPIFHPDYLAHLAILGKFDIVHQILIALHKSLKYFSEDDDLESYLGIGLEQLFGSNEGRVISGQKRDVHAYSDSVQDAEDDNHDYLTLEAAETLYDNLDKAVLWQISQHEQLSLSEMTQVFVSIEKHRRTIDTFGFRFLYSFSSRVDTTDEMNPLTSWREAIFASQSTSQDVLVNLVSRSFQEKLTWQHARQSGMFLWLSDLGAVRTQMEIVARNEYVKHDDRNPADCSLYYLALGKKNVLQGLWRMCVGNREKENTVKLLANNFTQPRWKTTALKNAYVLLSKRRFEYAAAFFLLGGSLKDAVNVCVHQIGQIELGIAIARVHEGDNGPVLRQLLTNIVLPTAADTGNRWMASWAFQTLGSPEKAIQALVRPLHTLISGTVSDHPDVSIGTKAAMSFQCNEPGLVVLYKHLRAALVKINKWGDVITPREEWNFVMCCARQYVKMGCDLLAMDLVRNWEFIRASTTGAYRKSDIIVQKKEVEDMREAVADGDVSSKIEPQVMKKPPPTQFQEPSASSLLDNFGF